MGSKSVITSHNVKREYRCDICGRTFSTKLALTSHSKRIHFTTPQHKPSSDNKRVGILRKGVNTTADEKPKAEILPKKRVIRTDRDYTKDIHFACPRCERLFKSYFSSRQHIVRYHCVNDKDEPVAENSPDIIKPIPRERCLKCQENVNSDDFHICSIDPDDLVASSEHFLCLGCNQSFLSIKLFDIHIPGLHSDGVQVMFFQKQDDLIEWIAEIEDSTDANYKLMNYNNLRQIYRCTYLLEDSNNIQFCPSSLHIQEYPRGFQVNFYSHHYGHECKRYQIKEKYKKNQITSLLERTDNYKDISKSISDPEDNYVQFKNVMEKVILEAAKLDPKHLREIMGMALEMSAVLNDYELNEEDTDRIPHHAVSNLNDNQISDALKDTDKSQRKKRKSSISPIPNVEMQIVEDLPLLKRKKSTGKRKLPLIINSYSLNNKSSDIIKKDKEPINSPKTRFLESLSDSPSFNDTYKSFLGKSLTEMPPPSNRRPKKTVVKTKIGQFKPNSPKKATPSDVKLQSPPLSPVNFDTLPKDISYEIKEQENDYNILILKC